MTQLIQQRIAVQIAAFIALTCKCMSYACLLHNAISQRDETEGSHGKRGGSVSQLVKAIVSPKDDNRSFPVSHGSDVYYYYDLHDINLSDAFSENVGGILT